jgi:Leucine-rich repeat (LRR) protein
LERLGDGVEAVVGMHDLWRAFCEAELEFGELRSRRWVYAKAESGSTLVETSPPGNCWENVKRMAFFGYEWTSLERVNFAHFANVTVLEIQGLHLTKGLVLNLSQLTHLKSLELGGRDLHRLVLQGLPRSLIFLRSASSNKSSRSSQRFERQVDCLTELQHLELIDYSGDKLPDMRSMISVRVAMFHGCENVVTLTGLSTKLSNLRMLYLEWCSELRNCPGVGDLVALEELSFHGCCRLKKLANLGMLRNLRKLYLRGCPLIMEVPGLGDLVALEELSFGGCRRLKRLADLGKLRNLRKLDVGRCPLIMEVPGLGGLVALEELYAGRFFGPDDALDSFILPDLSKLSKLRVLRLDGCPKVKAVPGFEGLVSLQDVEVDFREVVEWPSLRRLTKLQKLEIRGWGLEGISELDNLGMLRSLRIGDWSGVDKFPEYRNLISLQTLTIDDCEFQDMSGLSNLIALESLYISSCKKLERLPDFQRLPRLKGLTISGCDMLRRWDCRAGQVEGSPCRWDDACTGSDLPGSPTLPGLWSLSLRWCRILEDVTGIGAFSDLEWLYCRELPTVSELPDLSNFSRLKGLDLHDCKSLKGLTSCEPIHALSKVWILGCSSLVTLPDLLNFPGLVELRLEGCEGVSSLSSSGPLTALRLLKVTAKQRIACGVKELPDLGLFPALEKLLLYGCSGLSTLSSSAPLPSLRVLDARGCSSLSQDDLDQLQASCPQCKIKYGAFDVNARESYVDFEGSYVIVEESYVDVEESDETAESGLSRMLRCFRR